MKRKKRASAKKRVVKNPIIIKTSLIIIVIFVLLATIFKIAEIVATSKNNTFPKLEISLKDVPLEQINADAKDLKYPDNTISITINNETFSYDNVEIKGHGNSTWAQFKKPYQIKFSEKTNLFDQGDTKKWILLADYLDETHLRNDTAFFLADMLDQDYTYQGDHIELYVDDNYYGLYYITKKIGTNETGVNLKNDNGIIVELDNHYGTPENCNHDSKGNCFIEKDIVKKAYSASAMEDFISSINSLHEAVRDQDFKSIEEIIDIDSFAKYYLLNEFTVNPDAYNSSFYLYKDGEGSKIYAGPVWDFDIALGNKHWNNENMDYEEFHSPFETMVFKNYLGLLVDFGIPRNFTIIYDLMDIPEFEQRVKEIYQETLSGHKDELLNHIKSQADYIHSAALRDQERWKIKTDFDEEVDYLIDWVAKRYDHFEETYGVSSNEPDPENAEVTKSNETEPTPDPAPESEQPSSE